jgi:hypothetical protein
MSPSRRRAPGVGLTRRRFLRGAGALVALPFLESALPRSVRAQAGGSPAPRRALFYYVPNGMRPDLWAPTGEGRDFELGPTMEPLADLRGELAVLTGISNEAAFTDGTGDHANGTGSFLTTARINRTEGSDIYNGVSVDQVLADALGHETRFPSLQLGVQGAEVATCDAGYSCVYARNISWAGPRTPLSKLVDPQQVFDRLFRVEDAGLSAEEAALRRRARASVLDGVIGEAQSLQGILGTRDGQKLDEYLTGVRELERRLGAIGEIPTPSAVACEVPEAPGEDLDIEAYARVMTDLSVLAFQCDLTRFQSFMLADSGTNRYYDFLRVNGGHHDISHHQNDPSLREQLGRIDRWEVSQLAYLLERLRDAEDIDGSSLLDNTLVYFSSEVSDGNRHLHTNLPILLAGRAGGAFEPGRHIALRRGAQLASLYTSILQMFGMEADSFGADSAGPLTGL